MLRGIKHEEPVVGALAAGKNWTELLVPAMLVGNFGNAVGTFLGLGLSKVFYMLSW